MIIMRYAVVEVNGLQYRVFEGGEIETSRLNNKEGDTVELDKVLISVDGEEVKIGSPFIEGKKVSAVVEKLFLGEKVKVAKFKAKTGYRRKMGFRPKRSLLKINKI